jgi:hypothetical protein
MRIFSAAGPDWSDGVGKRPVLKPVRLDQHGAGLQPHPVAIISVHAFKLGDLSLGQK